ncbi:hypothetical protein BdWA1_000523 [Babesia duncani]|uniref:Uncharacterized protein n=1 Tax=Babesia duncani TaxID=323732 RepID=A0AAD9PMB1_9APIC|nr:hypothetical protein BdWA1_000523 [Babesia duncani]
MDYVPASYYNQSPIPKPKKGKADSDKQKVTFQPPPQLFSDQDPELPLQIESSATAIIPAISAEDHAFLENLERRRSEHWKKRRAEELKLIKEAEKIRRTTAINLEALQENKVTKEKPKPICIFKIVTTPKTESKITLADKTQAKPNSLNLLGGYSSEED